MNEEPNHWDALFDDVAVREERVVRSVLRALSSRATPSSDVWRAILVFGRPALAAAAAAAVIAGLAPRAAPHASRPPTVGAALGLPLAAERVIHRAEPASAHELLAALQEAP